MDDRSSPPVSTPASTAGVAQTRDRPEGLPRAGKRPLPKDAQFRISDGVKRHFHVRPYQRQTDDPVYRPLQIFALDPAVSKLDGAVAVVNVPYEPLKPGPSGSLFHVSARKIPPPAQSPHQHVAADDDRGGRGGDAVPHTEPDRKLICDLEDRRVLLKDGFSPARSDPRFHHQMVYAVCSSVYAAFRAALGRDPVWGFDREEADSDDLGSVRKIGPGVLIVRPQAFEGRNAYYDKTDGSLNFGYFTAENPAKGFMKGERVYTCLSHDVIVHELTHALLDGLRPNFTIPTQVDVLAFHEAFADLVSVFQHFSYREVVLAAIKASRGDVTGSLLTDLARPLGSAAERSSALRRAVDGGEGRRLRYDPKREIHELGSVLVVAVFDAFNTVYRRKVARFMRLATQGTAHLPAGELPSDLQDVLAEQASQLASQFLNICIRAIDYCPPIDLEFGDFLRAVITADRELVPDDPWGYREAWIDAFRERGILPSGVAALDEDALVWKPPTENVPPIKDLSFARLRFAGDPGHPADARELDRQAVALGRMVTKPENLHVFGLERPRGRVCKPRIESIRSARRVGPDGQILFDMVAEVSQWIGVMTPSGRPTVVYGGSTVILGPRGEIRYIIGKRASPSKRAWAQTDFMESAVGQRYWGVTKNRLEPRKDLMMALHSAPSARNVPAASPCAEDESS